MTTPLRTDILGNTLTAGVHAALHDDANAAINTLVTEVAALQVAPPTGAAGGALAGAYPNPTLAAGVATGGALGADVVVTTDTRLSNARVPSGAAGGALASTYPNPTLAPGVATGAVLGADVVTTADSRLTNSRAPNGAAAGSLAGTYPNPTLAPGVATGAVLGADVLTTGSAQAKTGTLTGPFSDKGGAVFNVKAYGATGDGSTDDTVAIQAAITAAKAAHVAGGGSGAVVYLPHGTYVISSLNLTGIGSGSGGFQFMGAGIGSTRIMPRTGNVHALDCTGSSSLHLRDFMMGYTPGDAAVKTGILLAQTAGLPSNAIFLSNVLVYLKASIACLYNYGVPSSTSVHCAFLQNQAAAVPTVYFSATNAAATTSAFATITSGTLPTSDWTFLANEFHDFTNDGNGTALKLEGTSSLRFIGGNISSNNSGNNCVAYVLLVGNNDSLVFDGPTFYSDAGFAPLMGIQNSSGTCTNLSVSGCAIQASSANIGGGGTYNTFRYFGKTTATSVVGSGAVCTLIDPDVVCDGKQINVSTGTITRGILRNPGTITSGINTAWLQSNTGVITAARYKATGTAIVAGDFAVGANWGNTASVSVAAGSTDQKGTVTVTCGGTGIAANPTLTLTFKDGTWATAPAVLCQFVGGSGAGTSFGMNISPGATSVAFQMFFTPTTGLTYTFSWICMGGPT